MNEITYYRILSDVVLAISIWLAPWWVTAVVGIVGVGAFNMYVEIVVAALVIDAMYSVPTGPIYSHFMLTYASIIVLVITQLFEPYLR